MGSNAYARCRGISGPAVCVAKKKGRLVECFKDRWGKVTGKIQDVALADEEWERNTDLSKAPAYVKERAARQDVDSGDTEVRDLSKAAAEQKHWQAKQARLKFEEAARELVPAKDVRLALENEIHACRTRLLRIPSRARQAMPELTTAQLGGLEELIREALEGLAAGEVAA